jgi:hypothetical protein
MTTKFLMQSKDRAPLPELFRLVLKYVYDYSHLSNEDENRMKNSIQNWFNWIAEEKKRRFEKYGPDPMASVPVGLKGNYVDEVEFALSGYAWLIRENDKGRFEERKKMFKDHGIMYQKFYGLPEFYLPSDFKRARAALEKAMRENPEDYRNDKN